MEKSRFDKVWQSLVTKAIRPLDYLALYAFKVVSQSNDGSTLDVQSEDPRMAPLTKVPLRLGLPGASVKVAAGARVLIGWENGDPIRPFASLWDTATVTELRLNADNIILNGGTKEVARKGDKTAGHSHNVIFALSAVPVPVPPLGNFAVEGTITINTNDDTINEGAAGVKA